MFFNIYIFITSIFTTRLSFFEDIYKEVDAKIDKNALKETLKESHIVGLDDSKQATIILTCLIYCKSFYKTSDITTKEVMFLVRSSLLT